MKKRIYKKKLSRSEGSRRALFRGLVASIVEHNEIKTTETKAKWLSVKFAKLVNIAKKDTLHSRRRLYALLGNDRHTSDRLVKKIVPNLDKRILNKTSVTIRRGDNVRMVKLELNLKKKEVSLKTKKDSKPSKREKKGIRSKLTDKLKLAKSDK